MPGTGIYCTSKGNAEALLNELRAGRVAGVESAALVTYPVDRPVVEVVSRDVGSLDSAAAYAALRGHADWTHFARGYFTQRLRCPTCHEPLLAESCGVGHQILRDDPERHWMYRRLANELVPDPSYVGATDGGTDDCPPDALSTMLDQATRDQLVDVIRGLAAEVVVQDVRLGCMASLDLKVWDAGNLAAKAYGESSEGQRDVPRHIRHRVREGLLKAGMDPRKVTW